MKKIIINILNVTNCFNEIKCYDATMEDRDLTKTLIKYELISYDELRI